MTLVVAIPAQEGVVMGSDTQITTGAVRSTTQKVFRLNTQAIWAGAGEVALVQRVAESIKAFPGADQQLESIRDNLARIVKGAVQSLLELDFRTQFVATSPDHLLGLHPGDFLFAEHAGAPKVLHILANGTPEWIDAGRFAATGSGDLFAHALLQKYAGQNLTCEQAKILAYKVIEEAIEVGAYGLGPPIDIWEVSESGASQASDEEIAALADTAGLIREYEVQRLVDQAEPSVQVTE